jgi:hypothetical protein
MKTNKNIVKFVDNTKIAPKNVNETVSALECELRALDTEINRMKKQRETGSLLYYFTMQNRAEVVRKLHLNDYQL